jgi:hypothetical protein
MAWYASSFWPGSEPTAIGPPKFAQILLGLVLSWLWLTLPYSSRSSHHASHASILSISSSSSAPGSGPPPDAM